MQVMYTEIVLKGLLVPLNLMISWQNNLSGTLYLYATESTLKYTNTSTHYGICTSKELGSTSGYLVY